MKKTVLLYVFLGFIGIVSATLYSKSVFEFSKKHTPNAIVIGQNVTAKNFNVVINELKKDLNRASKYYSKIKEGKFFSRKCQSLIDSNGVVIDSLVLNSSFYKWGKNSCYFQDSIIRIQTNEVQLVIIPSEKLAVLNNPDERLGNLFANELIDIEEADLGSVIDTISSHTSLGNSHIYRYKTKVDPEIWHEIEFNSKGHIVRVNNLKYLFIEEINSRVTKKNEWYCILDNINANDIHIKSKLNILKKLKGNKYKLSGEYSDYTIEDNRIFK